MATKKAGGRLPRYKTKEEIEEKIEAYFRSCEGEILLDENGNAVLKGLALCYSYYGGNGLNDLPAGAFMARKGFYYGWMTPDGQWLYCRSIFASSTDEHGYGDLI